MRGSRFVFLAMQSTDDPDGVAEESIMWMLVSPNNRRLGRAERHFPTYELCRETVFRLRRRYDELKPVTATAERSGHWVWRVELDGAVVAKSTRAYLRQQECDYNLNRFMAAVPEAVVATSARSVRIGRIPGAERP